MKRCPKCGQAYDDAAINFCLNDGELLLAADSPSLANDDSPPTLMMDAPRPTDPGNWTSEPITQWMPPTPTAYDRPSVMPMQQSYGVAKDQTIPVIAMVLGIVSIPLMCCYGGIWIGLPAAVLGFLGMRNADSAPDRYAGRGFAIAGMVLGLISFLLSVIFVLFAIVAN